MSEKDRDFEGSPIDRAGQIAEILKEGYESSGLKVLAPLIPFGFGSAIENILLGTYDALIRNRQRIFFEELDRGNIRITEQIAQDNEFVHCFTIALNAASRCHREEKIRLIARLLTSKIDPEVVLSVDEYERYLGVIDDLTFDEIRILAILDKHLVHAEI